MKILFVLLLCGCSGVFSQNFNFLVCPSDWVSNDNRCYHFVNYPPLAYDEAARACQRDGAILLSVDDDAEHFFVRSRLKSLDVARNMWYTSGERDTGIIVADNYRYVWTATNVEISLISSMWIDRLEPVNNDKSRVLVAYKYDFLRGLYGLAVIPDRTAARPYICEISKNEVYRINLQYRDFDYGIPYSDINEVKRGPKFIVEAKDTVILSRTTSVFLECIASGIPQPSYLWTRTNTQENVNTMLDSRYTITNGRLSIQNPTDRLDAGVYQCQASNSEGVILSSPTQLSFDTLGEFSNVQTATVNPVSNKGTTLLCPEIPSKRSEGIRYTWMKEAIDGSKFGEFVRPALNYHLFISGDGKLMFSEVTSSDNGIYYCVATLTSTSLHQNYIGASQPPSRTSMGITLNITSSGGGEYDPEIQDGFIKLIPSKAITGMNISLECFAYGTMPMKYEWSFPQLNYDLDRYKLTDSNRILNIQNVNLEDSGKYSCRVRSLRSGGARDSREYMLTVESRPEFLLPLIDQHLDVGTQQLTWRCEARAVPFPTYTWYKDGVQLTDSTTGDSSTVIHKNTLIITNLDKELHEGMYQCAAKNQYGEVFSTAQLRVLSIAPTFAKSPMTPTMGGALNGNITIPCNPEAAPFPETTWQHQGGSINAQIDSQARVRLLLNGDLAIQGLTQSDQGQYVCTAKNSLGEASGRTYLHIYTKTQIYRGPSPEFVGVNKTGFLQCRASHNQDNLDLVYVWKFNGRPIHIDSSAHYRRGTPPDNEGGLYLIFAQFDHTGVYTCEARTQVDFASASTFLTVTGPPSEPAGVSAFKADPNEPGQSNRDVILRWTDPIKTHGSPIVSYMIYGYSNYSAEWIILKAYVPEQVTITTGGQDSQRRQYLIQNLKPGVSYKFKIKAVNGYGVGGASEATDYTVIPSASPSKVPDNIGGGGGSVGTLRITWTPLDPEDHGGWGIGYIVEWREKPPPGQELSNVKWNKAIVEGNVGEFSKTVGIDKYYMPYNVKVSAKNMDGEGPVGVNDTVFSAEAMPNGIPGNIYASPFNESAIIVYWDPVPNTREVLKGRLKGYKISYWLKDTQTQENALQAILYEDTDHGMIIGLQPDTWYTVNVIVFNHAGNGIKSEVAYQSTDRSAPKNYPVNVEVYPHGESSVRVRFRGLSTGITEEPLLGYKLRYWRETDDIRNADNVDCEKTTEGIIYQIQPDYLYHLRVLGYSQGGDGKMSSPETIFSYIKGRVTQANIDPATSEVKYVLHDYNPDSGVVRVSVCLLSLLTAVVTAIIIM